MTQLALLFALLQGGAPIWELKNAAECTDEELTAILHSSPWVQVHRANLLGSGRRPATVGETAVHIMLASAAPIREAEQEWRRRRSGARADSEFAADSEYEGFLAANPDRYIILAVRLTRPELVWRERSARRMESESRLKIGGRSYELVGHFPPTRDDPYLRLVFRRDVREGDTELRFELYLPGAPLPFRVVRFELDKLIWRGRPAY